MTILGFHFNQKENFRLQKDKPEGRLNPLLLCAILTWATFGFFVAAEILTNDIVKPLERRVEHKWETIRKRNPAKNCLST
jgi:hypothetical protein